MFDTLFKIILATLVLTACTKACSPDAKPGELITCMHPTMGQVQVGILTDHLVAFRGETRLAELALDSPIPGPVTHCDGADVIITYDETSPDGCRGEDSYELAEDGFSRSGGVVCGR